MKYSEKLNSLKIHKINNSNKYLCKVRKSFIPATPEEKVRQNFLEFLINKIQVPINKIKVEESLAHYNKGIERMDILILDNDDIPFIIYECKKETEAFTEDVIDQTLGYFDKIEEADYFGIVIGNELIFYQGRNTDEMIDFAEHPLYTTLINGGEIISNDIVFQNRKRNNWAKPINSEIIRELINYEIIGKGTDEKFHQFLVNLDGYLMDEKDETNLTPEILDLGLKFTKFGNAGGGDYFKDYRSFLINDLPNKPIVSISLTTMFGKDENNDQTAIIVGIEDNGIKNSSLQLRIDNYSDVSGNEITIFHSGRITVGKIGAAKNKEIIDYIRESKYSYLINDSKILLGKINFEKELNSTNQELKTFLIRIIKYSLVRNEFRIFKKNKKKD